MSTLQDGYGRGIEYLRLSVTDRCDFRCVYCMAEDMTFLPRQQVLTLEEIQRIAAPARRQRKGEVYLIDIARLYRLLQLGEGAGVAAG